MWLINSSIGRKVVMSVTGIALVLFLTFHASMNVVALISAKGYNMICEFLGANWYAVAATVGLAALVALHFIFAIWLTIQNRCARGNNRYAVSDKPEKVEWELAETENVALAANGVFYIAKTFSSPVYTVIYLVWLFALWLHLNHGIWSSVQTLGWSGKIWLNRWRCIGSIYATVVILMFAAVALAYCFGYRPADFNEFALLQAS